VGVFVRPIGEDDHIVPIRLDGVFPLGFDDDRAVDAALLLKAGVAVIPVGARVSQLELEEVATARGDGGCGEVGDTVHRIGDEEAVPMDRGLFTFELVVDGDAGNVALAEPEGGTGEGAIDGEGRTRFCPGGGGKGGLVNREFVFDDLSRGGEGRHGYRDGEEKQKCLHGKKGIPRRGSDPAGMC